MREREIELNPVQSLINPTVDRRCFSPGRRSKRLHFLINSPSRSQLVRSERGAQPEVIRLSLRALSWPRRREKRDTREKETHKKKRKREREGEKNGWLEFASSDLKIGIIFSSCSPALPLFSLPRLPLCRVSSSSIFYRILCVAEKLYYSRFQSHILWNNNRLCGYACQILDSIRS